MCAFQPRAAHSTHPGVPEFTLQTNHLRTAGLNPDVTYSNFVAGLCSLRGIASARLTEEWGMSVGGKDRNSKEISCLLPPLTPTCWLPAGQAVLTQAIYTCVDWQLLIIIACAIISLSSSGFVHEPK